jgi:dolichol-phosphate mannosyltransferase|tara:strand:- start:227 stop:877 length:651 start_codon:yes stop_codon:yes gene_type:complete
MPVEVISYYPNKGVKEAFMVGFKEAIKIAEDRDIIITKEADNTSDLNILKKMISLVNNGNDVVLASCYAKEGKILNTTKFRFILSYFANLILKIFFPMPQINTYSSFYRAFRLGPLKHAFKVYGDEIMTIHGFVCVVEMLVNLSRFPISVVEVPLILDAKNRIGISKMRRRQNLAGYLEFFLKQLFRSREKEKIKYFDKLKLNEVTKTYLGQSKSN